MCTFKFLPLTFLCLKICPRFDINSCVALEFDVVRYAGLAASCQIKGNVPLLKFVFNICSKYMGLTAR